MTAIGTEKPRSASRRRVRGNGSSRGDGYRYSVLSIIAQVALGAVVLGVPWFLGGVHARTQYWLAIGVLISLTACLLPQLRKEAPAIPLPVAIVPLMLAVAFGFAQLWPLPAGVLQKLSPRSVELWQSLDTTAVDPTLGQNSMAFELGVSGATGEPTISLYPASTCNDLALLLVAAGLFFLGVCLFSAEKQPVVLFTAVAILGTAMAFFGIAQQLTGADKIYGSIELKAGGAPFAAFVNRNNAGGFLNLCLAGAIGLAVWAYSRKSTSTSGSEAAARMLSNPMLRDHPLLRTLARHSAPAIAFLADFNAWKLFSLTAMVFITAGIICSLSRGSWTAGMGGLVAMVLIAAIRFRSRTAAGLALPAAILGFALVAWVGKYELVQARWEQVGTKQLASDGRWQLWQTGLEAARDFPLVGSGLGTFRYIYLQYLDKPERSWAYYAENQLVTALVEAGVVGVLLLAACLVLVLLACARLLREPGHSTGFACGVACLFALVTQSIGGFFDFGLYLPANFALLALFCGTAAGRAASLHRHRGHDSERKRWYQKLRSTLLALPRIQAVPAASLVLVTMGVLWSVAQLSSAATVDAAMKAAVIPDSYSDPEFAQIDGRIAQLSVVVHNHPNNADAQRRLARLWIRRYRGRAMAAIQRDAILPVKDEAAWTMTAPLNLHNAVYRLGRENRTIELENLRRSPEVQTDLVNGVRHLLLSRDACPLFADVQLLLAELGPVVTPLARDGMRTEIVRRLAGSDVEVLAECGIVDYQAGRFDAAITSWRRCVDLDASRFPKFLQEALAHPELKAHIDRLMPDSPEYLIKAARDLPAKTENAEIRALLLSNAAQLLDGPNNLPKPDQHQLRGTIYAMQEKTADAIEQYSLAVELKPLDTELRFQLAELLLATNDLQRARDHLAECWRLEPENKQFETSLRQLIRKDLIGQ